MSELKRALRLLLALLAAGAMGAALPGRALAAFADLGYGARATGMGNAFTAVADDAYAVFYNPAGLTELREPEFSASYSRLYVGLTDNSNLGAGQIVYATPLKGGQWGRLGLGFDRFSLSGMYAEQQIIASYGHPAFTKLDIGRIDWGLNLKLLNRSFTPPPEATNAIDPATMGGTGLPDPVLTGPNSKSAVDADLGLMLRTPERYTVGLMVQHVLQPNVSFGGDTDKLPMAFKFGGAYKMIWTNIAADLQLEKAPDGTTDKILLVGAERYFPTLDYGQFGLRGSLGYGSRDFKQLTLGLGYRINKVQVDYAFILPFGTVSGTLGTHRLAVTYHFGAPSAELEYASDLIENLRKTHREAEEGYTYEFEELKDLPPTEQVLGAMIKANLQDGKYDKAYRYLDQMVENKSQALKDLQKRLGVVVPIMPELTDPKLKWEKTTAKAIRDWLAGQSGIGVKRMAYAFSMHSDDPVLENLLKAMEASSGLKGERVSPKFQGRLSLVDEKTIETELGLRERRLDDTAQLAQEILELEPTNSMALSRLGTAQYLQGKLNDALASWTQAAQFEENADERRVLYRAMHKLEQQLKMTKPAAKPGEAAPEQGAAAPAQGAAAPAANTLESLPDGQKAAPGSANPREIENLYRLGVERYAAGDKDEAAAYFRRILSIDPENVQAQKALDRIQKEP